MNILLGASGQIGSLLVRELAGKGKPVRAVIRDASKGKRLREMGVEVAIADYLSVAALQEAFHGGDAVFLLTPENPFLEQPDQEVRQIIANYQEAVRASSIRRIVGLSSMGAQHDSGTGSLLASHWLEQAFAGTDRECRFIRPAYYYSNWLGYLEQMQQHGVLPSFFPPELAVPMIAPTDVARCLADAMTGPEKEQRIVEISGPRSYRAMDIAAISEDVLGRSISVQHIPPEAWQSTLLEVGYSDAGAANLMQMTQAVIDGKTTPASSSTPVSYETEFKPYLQEQLRERS